MLSDYYSLNTAIEFICLVLAFICLKEAKNSAWRLMIVLLLATFISETVGRYVFLHSVSQNNHWVYNILIWFEIIILHIMFAHLFRRYPNFKLMFILGIIILSLCYGYDMYKSGFFWYSNHTNTVMSVLFIFYSLIYYYYLFKDEEYIDLRFFPAFWWVTGVLLFSFGATASNLFDDQLYAVKLFDHHLTYYIFRVLNIVLYGCWSYSFICKKWVITT